MLEAALVGERVGRREPVASMQSDEVGHSEAYVQAGMAGMAVMAEQTLISASEHFCAAWAWGV